MRKIFFLINIVFLFTRLYSNENFQLKEISMKELIIKSNFIEQIELKILDYIQNNYKYIDNTKNGKYENIYELSKNCYEKVYLCIYKVGDFIVNYLFIIIKYDEINDMITSINITEIDNDCWKNYKHPWLE